MMGGSRDARLFQTEEVTSSRTRYLLPVVSILIILTMQILHFGVIQYIWSPNKEAVNKNTCTCGCWDTVFKGSYETPPAYYKHFYFNTTLNTLQIWVLTVTALVAFYESLKYILHLLVVGKLRASMAALFSSVIYSHYYAWWNYVNYLNDDFYQQWYHQMFFTVTELASTILVFGMCNTDSTLAPSKLMAIISIAITHILVSGADQFILNVIFQQGHQFQIFRDLGFMLPDVLHVFIPAVLLIKVSRDCGMPLSVVLPRNLICSCGLGIVAATLLAKEVMF